MLKVSIHITGYIPGSFKVKQTRYEIGCKLDPYFLSSAGLGKGIRSLTGFPSWPACVKNGNSGIS